MNAWFTRARPGSVHGEAGDVLARMRCQVVDLAAHFHRRLVRIAQHHVERRRALDRQFQRPIAYDVDYVVRGVKYRSRLPQDPGNRLRVKVAVTPMVPEGNAE